MEIFQHSIKQTTKSTEDFEQAVVASILTGFDIRDYVWTYYTAWLTFCMRAKLVASTSALCTAFDRFLRRCATIGFVAQAKWACSFAKSSTGEVEPQRALAVLIDKSRYQLKLVELGLGSILRILRSNYNEKISQLFDKVVLALQITGPVPKAKDKYPLTLIACVVDDIERKTKQEDDRTEEHHSLVEIGYLFASFVIEEKLVNPRISRYEPEAKTRFPQHWTSSLP